MGLFKKATKFEAPETQVVSKDLKSRCCSHWVIWFLIEWFLRSVFCVNLIFPRTFESGRFLDVDDKRGLILQRIVVKVLALPQYGHYILKSIFIYVCMIAECFYCTYITISAYSTHSSKAESLNTCTKKDLWTCDFQQHVLLDCDVKLNNLITVDLLFNVSKQVMNAMAMH